MNNSQYIKILEHPDSIGELKTKKLEELVKEFPYFQSARSLLLKGLHKTNSYKYNSTLKQTAAYTIDRKVLFDFITSPIFINNETSQVESLEGLEIINSETIIETNAHRDENNRIQKERETATTILEIGKPIEFNSSEPHSFNQWMQLISKTPIIRKEKNLTKFNLIDTFIESNPKIKPVQKNVKNIDASPESSAENESLMTETLAKVYLEQKKYENAIKAYHILSLKYPEKSGFFADRIKAIKILQKNKS